MKRLFSIIAVLAMCLAVSCERYQQVPQNHSFSIGVAIDDAAAGEQVPFVIRIDDGTVVGQCMLKCVVSRVDGGAAPAYDVFLNGRTKIDDAAAWRFDDNGEASFFLSSLPAGVYNASFTVSRWYHKATAVASFTVNP